MYKVFTSDGTVVGYTESIRYIKVADNGCYVETDAQSAEGIAVDGTAYSLVGRDTLDGAETAVGISQFDGAALIAEQESIIDDLLISELEG